MNHNQQSLFVVIGIWCLGWSLLSPLPAAELLENGNFAALPQAPPVLNWQSSGEFPWKMAPDIATGQPCPMLSVDKGKMSAEQTVFLMSSLTSVPTGKAVIAVEARGTGMLKLIMHEYKGPVEKLEWCGSVASRRMPLTPEWRWYFLEYDPAGRGALSRVGLMILIAPADDGSATAQLRTASVRDAAPTSTLAPVEDVTTELVVPLLTAPALKGDLSDPVWAKATHVAGFIDDTDPRKRLSSRHTDLYLFHDADALYIGARSRIPAGGSPIAHDYPRDSANIYWDDNFEIGLIPPGLGPSGVRMMYQFITNASGNLYDGTFRPAVGFDGKWNGNTSVAAKFAHGAFTMEMRIPLKDMQPDMVITPGDQWRFTLVRNFRDKPIWYQDHLTPLKNGFADWDRFVRLTMAGDATAVDVNLADFTAGRPVFSLQSNASAAMFRGNLQNTVSRVALTPPTEREVTAAHAGSVGALLDYVENNGYRAELSLTRKSDDAVLARIAREFSTRPPTLKLTPDIDCLKQVITLTVDAQGLPPVPGISTLPALIEVEKKDDPRVLVSMPCRIEPGQMNTITLPIDRLTDGVHLIDCTVRNGEGTLLAEGVEPVRLYKDLYWLNNKLGEDDVVPRPFTKPVFDSKGMVLRNWGHQIVLGASVLPEQMIVQGIPLLAAPIRLEGVVNGKPWALQGKLKRVNAGRVSGIELEGKTAAGAVQTGVQLNFEYDGMLRIDVSLAGKKPITINRLTLHIPMRKEAADVLTNISGPHLQEGTTGFTGMTMLKDMEYAKDLYYTDLFYPERSGVGKWPCQQFWPMIWMSNMDRGLCWFTETGEPFNVAPGHNYYALNRNAQMTELVVHLVDTPVTTQRWSHTFGLQAFPVRPWDKSVEREMWGQRMEHLASMPNIEDALAVHRPGGNMLFVTNPGPGTRSLDDPLNKMLLVMDPWIVMHHAPDDGKQRQLFRQVGEFWTKPGRRLFIYNNSNYTWWNSPEYKYFKAQWDMGGTPGQFPEWEMIEVNRASQSWQDYWVYHFYYMLKRYPENFFSIDCSVVQSNDRAENGMGYTKDGKRHQTLNIFETRRMYKRLYVIADRLRANPITLLSASGYWAPMTMSFCNISESGEEWRGWEHHQFEHPGRNLDLFRYLCASRVGPVRGWLNQVAWNDPWVKSVHSQGIVLLHNIYYADVYQPYIGADKKILERIGLGVREDLTFHPYWKPMREIITAQNAFKISYWSRPGGAFAVVMNVDWDKPAAGDVTIDTAALGLNGAKITLFDPVNNTLTTVPNTNTGREKVHLEIPANVFMLIMLEQE
jgi:hypothetical protein